MSEEGRKQTLEMIFIVFFGFVILSAFVAALSYDILSARTPLFIMVPLLILIGVQFNRTRKAMLPKELQTDVTAAAGGNNKEFNKIMGLIAWMCALLVVIYIAGHYLGIVIFMFLLLHIVAKESLRLSIIVTVSVTAFIYVLFEHGFNIELYRGLIYRMLFEYGF
jgi:Flp pilus assembly protein TadB